MATIKVNSIVHKVLLTTELLGQFSDGRWENSRNKSWKYLDGVKLTDEEAGVYFDDVVPYSYKAYNCNDKELLSYVDYRMIGKAKAAKYLGTDISPIVYIIEKLSARIFSENSISKCTLDDVNEVLNDLANSTKYFKEIHSKSELFFDKFPKEDLVNALNSDYWLKDLRKDLRLITNILKNTK